jgi:hypothetical protein
MDPVVAPVGRVFISLHCVPDLQSAMRRSIIPIPKYG